MILEARAARIAGMWMAVAGVCFAGEFAVLSTGFRIHADRHETDGSVVRLYANGGMTQLPASSVAKFEAEETIPEPTAASVPAPVTSPTPEELVTAAAQRNGLPPELVHSVVAAESAFRTDSVSRKGAVGLMQLMPSTAREYGVDPTDPKQNVEAGTQYLRDLLVKYDGRVSRALAAYNAGPGAVDRYHGVPPYRETQAYVARVIKKYDQKSAASKHAKPKPGEKTPGRPSPPE